MIGGLCALTSTSAASLAAVSGWQQGGTLTVVAADGDPAAVAVGLAHGFPLWYEDGAGRRLQLCLDPELEVAPGVVVNPCEYEPPVFGAPPSFPGNFGAEALYWSAVAVGSYVSSDGIARSALLVMALEAAGANEGALDDGNQAVFSRIRLRINVPVPGSYRVTHPYGSRTYVVTAADRLREWHINQTHDLGLDVPQDFLAAMHPGPVPAPFPAPGLPSVDAGIVNLDGAGVGPFLVPARPWTGPLDPADPESFLGGPVAVNGATYLALPVAPNLAAPTLPFDLFQPVSGSLFIPDGESEPANYFRIELLDAAGGFQLNPGDAEQPQRVQFDDFLLVGKLYDGRPNQPPTAHPDALGAAPGQALQLEVLANDTDVVAPGNAHGLHPQALALVDPARLDVPWTYSFASGLPQLTATQTTEMGGTVRRVTSIASGRTTFLYTPPIGYLGPDRFHYVVQDAGGLVSEPATATITVEALQLAQADYRARFGQWLIRGSSSDSLANGVSLFYGPRAHLDPAQQVQAFPVFSAARAQLGLRVGPDAIEFLLGVAPLPATAVTAARIHYGAPGSNGPAIFSLYESFLGLPLAVPRSGVLTAFDLQARPAVGISSFADAVAAILAGDAYVNLTTVAYPAGELRGQLRRALLGRAPVRGDGSWEFRGRAPLAPGPLPAVSVASDNQVETPARPLRLR